MGILVTGASIVVMCVSGVAVSTVFKWLHTYEYNFSNGEKEKTDHRERMQSMMNRPKNAK
ncbi:hypothetical protein BCP78_0103 [Bacillus phage BCP78]|uniref:Uncharacterized protein n=3 Tax=Tsarbombavirus BCP78 TaxID=1985182 RepID=J9PRL5_9CAUD|nr:hypothetical protein BCP78_0103 [Bacillus phage BCP78]YP_009783466.1 hypothetical protein QLX27_gp093 [Bacillus phage BCU4]ALA07690.1 hypothetical protein PBC6_097 [Bacillus phage PBC6]AQN32481.1 hypothetical protein BCP12_063 [Bacillus phage BCP12]AEW47110.1 hypothetical protein BCP78_0103 [Bacillus phage BCP78]AEW47599.1 hypothetical protein BCU4_0093 [Bacillus phage BCU4]